MLSKQSIFRIFISFSKNFSHYNFTLLKYEVYVNLLSKIDISITNVF